MRIALHGMIMNGCSMFGLLRLKIASSLLLMLPLQTFASIEDMAELACNHISHTAHHVFTTASSVSTTINTPSGFTTKGNAIGLAASKPTLCYLANILTDREKEDVVIRLQPSYTITAEPSPLHKPFNL